MPPERTEPRTPSVDVRRLAQHEIAIVARALGKEHARYYRRRLPDQRAGRGLVLIAWHGHRPVGGLFATFEPPDERSLRTEYAGVPVLYHVWVAETRRGRGIGTQLCRATHDLLRRLGYRRVALGVERWNQDAIRLYERLGYVRIGRAHGIRRPAGHHAVRGTRGYDLMILDLQKIRP